MTSKSINDLVTGPLLLMQEQAKANPTAAVSLCWLMGTTFKADDRQPTGYTDGLSVSANPDWLASLNGVGRVFFLFHESMHPILGHTEAIKIFGAADDALKLNDVARTRMICNIVQDILINETWAKYIANGAARPSWKTEDGKTTGPVFLDWKPEGKKHFITKEGREQFDLDQHDFYWLIRHIDKDVTDKIKSGGAGQGGDIIDAQGAGAAQQVANKVAGAFAQATAAWKNWDNAPAWLQRLFDAPTQPKCDWRRALAEWTQATVPSEYSMARLKRPYAFFGAACGSISKPGMGTVVLACDTSGSMTDDVCNAGCSEFFEIHKSLRPERIVAIACDAEIGAVTELSPDDEFKFELKGGGGTDFCPVFQYIKDNDITPSGLVFFTDLYGTLPDEEPDYPVLWLVCPGGDSEDPPFGTVVRMESL